MLRWSAGPTKLGCIYHQRGVRRFGEDSLVVDVFVMPKIFRRRPIAITIGRYRDYKPVAKREWQLADPRDRGNVAEHIAELFESVGAQKALAKQLGSDVEQLLGREATKLAGILGGLAGHSAD
jgi:hypothetical protein